jgi:hypothetical protein
MKIKHLRFLGSCLTLGLVAGFDPGDSRLFLKTRDYCTLSIDQHRPDITFEFTGR